MSYLQDDVVLNVVFIISLYYFYTKCFILNIKVGTHFGAIGSRHFEKYLYFVTDLILHNLYVKDFF